MKRKLLITISIVLVCVFAATADDNIVATKVRGGLPPLGKNGKPLEPDRVVIAEIKGEAFESIRPDVQAVVKIMADKETWCHVGPDSGYVSFVIELNGKTYTINSWGPLYKDIDTVAVTDKGLVGVASRTEKEARESQNEEKYKTMMKFLNKVLKIGATAKKSAGSKPATQSQSH